MQEIRNKYGMDIISRQKSIEFIPSHQEHYMPHYRKKYKKVKNVNYTNSINSLETKRSTENILKRHKAISHRKGLSINAIEAFDMPTDRQAIIQEFPKRHSEMKPLHFNFRNRSQRLNSISQKVLDYKQKKLQDCIQLMKGVLEQIKNQKSCRQLVKPIVNQQPKEKAMKQNVAIVGKQQCKSNFEKYINSITKLKSDSKILIIKKNRSKPRSTINNQNMFSNRLLKADKLECLKKQKQDDHPQQMLVSFNISNTIEQREDDKLEKEEQPSATLAMKNNQIESIECSSIARMNESSFISEHGKNSMVKNILEENMNIINKQKGNEQKKGGRMKNSKVLKHIFPNDFF